MFGLDVGVDVNVAVEDRSIFLIASSLFFALLLALLVSGVILKKI